VGPDIFTSRRTTLMAKFLIEVPHESERMACARAVQIFLNTGSHFMTHADWGCTDGEHKAWIVVDVENKDEARAILPPAYREQAKITRLNAFGLDEVNDILARHHS
jgi:hypothetical protein